MARRNRRCGGRAQRKVGYLRARHGKSSLTTKFKANTALMLHRRQTILAMLRTFVQLGSSEQRWHNHQRRQHVPLIFSDSGRWYARGLVAA